MKLETKCVVSYVRVSTKEQMQGYSIEAQSEELNSYIGYHYKNVSVERYSDKGKTATNINRRGLKRVLSRIESGEVDILIVKNLDRLVRNMENAIYIMKLLQL
ncbi:MAG: recombinase family protein [Bacilli bacterium]